MLFGSSTHLYRPLWGCRHFLLSHLKAMCLGTSSPPGGLLAYRIADFSAATVEVKDEANNPYGITQHAIQNGFGDNTIVWDMPGGALSYNGIEDKLFKVKVLGVKIGGHSAKPIRVRYFGH